LAIGTGKRQGPGLSPAQPSRTAVVALAAITGFLAGGVLVVLVAVLLALPQRRRILPLLAAPAYAVSGLVVALQPGRFPASGSGAFGPAAQILTILALIALVLSLLNRSEEPAASNTITESG
jgi:arabinofuranan 3-O-arabinosyltransferase